MATGSGLGASFGIGKETTYGTYAAPTQHLEITGEELKESAVFVQGGGLAAGRLARSGSRRAKVGVGGAGSVDMDVPTKGFGMILENLLGTTVTPVQQGATDAYLQTHAAADNFGKKLTVQKGVPLTTGTVSVFTFLGGKITSAEFSCGVDEILSTKINFDFREVVDDEALVAPVYDEDVSNWNFTQMSLKLGTYGAEAAVSGVTKVTVNIERPMNINRKYAGQSGRKSEPILNDLDGVKVTGTIEADYLDKTVFADRFTNNTETALLWEFVGEEIDTGESYLFSLSVPMVFFDGDTPTVSGPDVVSGAFPFVGQSDDTNPVVSVLYQSTDTSL